MKLGNFTRLIREVKVKKQLSYSIECGQASTAKTVAVRYKNLSYRTIDTSGILVERGGVISQVRENRRMQRYKQYEECESNDSEKQRRTNTTSVKGKV
jgi:hypothetical protein